MSKTNKRDMEICRRKILAYVLFIMFSVACPLRGQAVEVESGFSYNENSPLGPDNWGNIKPEWRLCNSGKMQSPIDLQDEIVEIAPGLGRLQTDYQPSKAILIKSGEEVMLKWVNGGGNITINGISYQLIQYHWHSPTEHSINGIRFDLEGHLVHESPDGRVAVIGILYKIGQPDSFLPTIEDELRDLAHAEDAEKVVGIVDPNQIQIGSGYYRYIGSLTTPPCSEDVVWTVAEKVMTVSRDQLTLIQQAISDDFGGNARPIQPLNGRKVQLYKPKDVGLHMPTYFDTFLKLLE